MILSFVEDPILFFVHKALNLLKYIFVYLQFDRGTNTYDTSEKQRKPAYTDRILHRVNPDKTFVQDC